MGLFDEGGNILNPSDFAGTFSGAPLTDMSWTASPLDNGTTSSSESGSFRDVASRLWGTAPTKTAEGTGAQGFLSDLGGVAKAVLPFAQIGTGLAGFLAQRNAMDQLARQGRTSEQATAQQIAASQTAQRASEQAQTIAPKAAELAPRIEAVADNVRPITDRLNATSDDIRQVASSVDPLAARTAALSQPLQDTAAATRTQTADPVVAYAAERLARAQRGEIPSAIQAQIDRWKAGALQQARDYLARSGMGDSTAMLQMERQIEEQANAATGNFLMNEQKEALGAFEQARSAFATTGNLYAQAGGPLKDAASIYGTEADILGKSVTPEEAALAGLNVDSLIRSRAGAAYGTAGQILAGAGASAEGAAKGSGTVARTAQSEQVALENLIASINASLSRLTGRAS